MQCSLCKLLVRPYLEKYVMFWLPTTLQKGGTGEGAEAMQQDIAQGGEIVRSDWSGWDCFL